MDYITVTAFRQEVRCELDDDALRAVIRRASAYITRALGAEPAETVTKRFRNQRIAWLAFEPAAILSLTENGQPVETTGYAVEGRAVYKPYSTWNDVEITYAVAEREDLLAMCEQVCVEMVKASLAQDGYASQRIGDWAGETDRESWERALRKLARWRPVMA